MRRPRILRTAAVLGCVTATGGALAATASAQNIVLQVEQAPVQGAAAVLATQGCHTPTTVIQARYAVGRSCASGGSDETWGVTPDTGNKNPLESAISTRFAGKRVCMAVAGGNYVVGTPIVVYRCNHGPTHNEKFLFYSTSVLGYPGVTIQPYYEPAGANLCFNVDGGYGEGHPIVLASCAPNGVHTEVFLWRR